MAHNITTLLIYIVCPYLQAFKIDSPRPPPFFPLLGELVTPSSPKLVTTSPSSGERKRSVTTPTALLPFRKHSTSGAPLISVSSASDTQQSVLREETTGKRHILFTHIMEGTIFYRPTKKVVIRNFIE